MRWLGMRWLGMRWLGMRLCITLNTDFSSTSLVRGHGNRRVDREKIAAFGEHHLVVGAATFITDLIPS
jgi:hypothetical protein